MLEYERYYKEYLRTGFEDMQLIATAHGAADLAFVQSDTPINPMARLVTPLYQEVLHILVAEGLADKIRTIDDLRGRRVAAGPRWEATRRWS